METMPMIPAGQLGPRNQDVVSSVRNERLESILSDLLVELGIDINEQHFRETPKRVARLYRELTRGYRSKPEEILKTFTSPHQELVVVSGIRFQSLCPHHMLIYRGTMHLGYVPNGRIVGLSKIPRLIQAMSARLIVQEELVAEIAGAFMEHVQPLGCVVKASGTHDCVAVRGVRAAGASMTTIVQRGVFRESQDLMGEFHQAVTGGAR
jgi:GTP cyclohydrolase I